MNVHFLLVCLLAYFAGSVPFGKIAGLIKGIDIQKKGSGNIGFANARRQLGWPIGIAVLLGDLLKGYLPALLAVHHFSTTDRKRSESVV
jgi:acyl phosphate:glycerol-3-phosphate acyltransferase